MVSATFDLCNAEFLCEKDWADDELGTRVYTKLSVTVVTPCVCVGYRVYRQHDIDTVVDRLSLLLLLGCGLCSLLFLLWLNRTFSYHLLLLLGLLSNKAKGLLLAYLKRPSQFWIVFLIDFHSSSWLGFGNLEFQDWCITTAASLSRRI